MDENKRNIPCVKSFEDFFKKYKIDSYITNEDLDSYVKTMDIVNNLTTGGEDKPLSAETMKDTGWQNLILSSYFELYQSGSVCRYRKIGKVVQIVGEITPKNDIAGSTTLYTIATVPTDFAPSKILVGLMQASGNAIWTIRINTSGTVSFSRHRVENASTWSTCSTGDWLPFQTTYFID